MKLELKHLAGYLPYGLEVIFDDKIGIIASIYLPAGKYNDNELWFVSLEENKEDSELSCSTLFSNTKPILRPLSYLAKEIEVNGEKFIPIEVLYDEIVYDTDEEFYRILKREWDDYDLIKSYPYRFVQKLLEWHFDIYGLIENNLAIDKNTLL